MFHSNIRISIVSLHRCIHVCGHVTFHLRRQTFRK